MGRMKTNNLQNGFGRTGQRCGFTIIELLAVVAIILILLALLIPGLKAIKERSQSTTCLNNMRQIGAGMMGYVADNNGFFPWAGGEDRNLKEDWVWGGQPKADTQNTAYWSKDTAPASFGFHAEAGSIFPYVEHKQPVRNGSGKNGIDETIRTIYPVYRCPSTAEIGEAMRVNFSMNDRVDSKLYDNNAPSDLGVSISHVKRLATKVLLINEDPRTMHNASFAPGGSADGDDGKGTSFQGDALMVMHYGGINVLFMDGHVSRFTQEEILRMQSTEKATYFEPLQ